MNKRLNRLLTILTLGTILLACSSSDTKNDQSQETARTVDEGQNNLADKDPEVILAIIQEGTNPPSERLVENFGELLSSLQGYYSDVATNEMADKLTKAYDLATEKGNEESLLEFISGYRNGVVNSIGSNIRYDFTEYLANYICYKTNCDNGDSEVLKFFDPDYIIPTRDSQYDIKESNQEKLEAELNEEREVLERLKKRAKRDWPDDYVTQEFWINEQVEAYRYMKMIPDDKIKRKAQRDWPLDFITQKFWYNEQIEARERLENN